MNRYNYEPGRTASPKAFQVQQIKGRFVVFGPYGRFGKSFASQSEADRHAADAKRHFEDSERAATSGISGEDWGSGPGEADSEATPAPTRPTPEPPPPIASPVKNPQPPMPSPLAHQVFSYGGKGQGYGVFDRTGGAEKQSFDSKDAAEAFAAIRRKFFEDLASGAARAASAVPSPPGPMAGPAPGQPPGSGNPWSSGMSPIPSPVAPGSPTPPWPAGMTPPASQPPAPPGPWPATMFGGAAGQPPPPVGPGGFPAGMYPTARPAAPAPPQGPMFGPAAPTYRTIIDALAPALSHAFQSLPHANGGQFHWQGFAQAGKVTAGVIPASTGPSVMASVTAAGWMAVGKEVARGFDRQLAAAGGFLSIGAGMGRFAESVGESNRRLAPYNGTVASAYTQLDYGDFRRNFQMGAATGDSAATLAKSIDKMRDAWSPTEILQANLSNRLGIMGASIGRVNANVIGLPATLANWAIDGIDPGGETSGRAGSVAGYAGWGLTGAMAGSRFGPIGAAAGFVLGFAGSAAADWLGSPSGPEDPWGDFLKESRSMPVLRPSRPVEPF